MCLLCLFPLCALLSKKKAIRCSCIHLVFVGLYTPFRIRIFFLEKLIMPPFVHDGIRIHLRSTYNSRIFLGINKTIEGRCCYREGVIFPLPVYGGESLRYV